ncbi:MAG: hypothetical protein V3S68_04875 [Dehalococcoidia bacterium]
MASGYETGVHHSPVDENNRMLRIGSKFQDSPPSVSTGDNVYLLVDAAGRLIVTQQYVPNIFKQIDALAVTAGVPATVWTPESGKTVRLLGYKLTAGSTSSIEFQDSAAAGTVILSTGVIGIVAPSISSPLGAGVVLAAPNNTLEIDVTSSITVSGMVYGLEE